MTQPVARPLDGYRVLDLSTVVAGPFGSEILASLGAEIIRIEPPPKGPAKATNVSTPVSDEDGFLFALQRNKSLLHLDLKSEEGRDAFLDLVRGADVVYDNFRPGVLKRLRINYDALAAINPAIVTCSISGYGGEGPWAEVGAYDVTVQALGGSMSITGNGRPGEMPCRWGVPIGDLTGSFYAVIGTLAALRERNRTGKGQAVEVSLLDGQLALNTYRVPQAFGAGLSFSAPEPRKGGAGTVPYGPFRCGDGAWLVLGVASNFWRAFCSAIGKPDWIDDARFLTLADRQRNQADLDAEIERVMLTADASTWQGRIAAAGVPVGKVNTIREAFEHEQPVSRGMLERIDCADGGMVHVAGSPIRFVGEVNPPQRAPVRTGAAPAPRNALQRPPAPPARPDVAELAGVPGPLGGTLVVELCGDEPSGTFGTQILADLGATVVKVELLPAAEAGAEPVMAGRVRTDIAYFFGLNRNKRSICLDLKSEAGQATLRRLVAEADVVYENYKPGTLARLGVDPATLATVAPKTIRCSVSGFGQTGPWSHLPAYDATIQALGGGMSLTGTGEPDDAPVRCGNPVAGIGGAFYAVIGILAALLRRDAIGVPAALDIALLDAQLAMHGYRVPPALSGRTYDASPRRGGSGALPYGPFPTRDGRWFVLGITSQFWGKAASLLGHPEWGDDPRFATERSRQENEPELNRLVSQAMGMADSEEWQRRFVAAGIPGAEVNSIAEAFTHPHVTLRNMLTGFDGPVGALARVAGNPIKLSGTPDTRFAAPPGLGADTDRVLTRVLGLHPAELAALQKARAAWSAPGAPVYNRPSVV